MNPTDALVNVTWNGRNADLQAPVHFFAGDAELLSMVAETIRHGGAPGLGADRHVDLAGFVVDRFPATTTIPYNRIFVRPKTPFGAR